MNYFRQIASRGWLGNAIQVLTFGYWPSPLFDPGQVDWCLSTATVTDWVLSLASVNDWALTTAQRFAWTPTTAAVNDWSLSVAEQTTWRVGVEVLACD